MGLPLLSTKLPEYRDHGDKSLVGATVSAGGEEDGLPGVIEKVGELAVLGRVNDEDVVVGGDVRVDRVGEVTRVRGGFEESGEVGVPESGIGGGGIGAGTEFTMVVLWFKGRIGLIGRE